MTTPRVSLLDPERAQDAIGAWRTVSRLTRSLEIPLEEGVGSWPPDGRPGGEP